MAAVLGGTGCVKTDGTLGQDYIPSAHIWKVASVSFDIDEIEMQRADELGGYSSKRISIGGILNEDSSLDERISAFTLIPLVDTLTFTMPDDAECTGFHFALGKDTLSFKDASQEHIIQKVRVYALQHPLDNDIIYSGKLTRDGYYKDGETDIRLYDPSQGVVTEGVPTYNGGDSLSFEFTRAFGNVYLNALKELKLGSVTEYAKKLPGVIMRCDEPAVGSGRINLFQCAVSTDDYNYLTGNYIKLDFKATYDERGQIDTSLIMLAGMSSMIDSETSTLPTQYAFNFSTGGNIPSGSAGDRILVEGGSGLKPVIRADVLINAIADNITAAIRMNIKDFDKLSESEQLEALKAKLDQTIVNRATIYLNYEHDEEFEQVKHFPKILSPTCRITATRKITNEDGSTTEQEVTTFAGLTDASVSSENQGNISRSLKRYQPDISHHAQELLRLVRKDGETEEEFNKRKSKYDIWMLIMHPETTTTTSSGDSSYNDYLNALAYSSYYNNL
ncbi:MAG: hypothetical protein ACI39U_08570, partial [Candidatus Cryptobacteroides sp.]